MPEDNLYDISIIGGGPIGMFAATYAGMRSAKVQLLESLGQLGGQPQALFSEKTIYDIPGFSSISGKDLIRNLNTQLQQFNVDVYVNSPVLNIQKTEKNQFKIITNNRISYSKSIIISTGIGSFEPRRLRIANTEALENDKLFYTVNDPSIFENKTIAIAGGGDSAIDWALELNTIAKDTTVIHRRNQFRAMESNVDKLKESGSKIMTPYTIDNLSTDNSHNNLTIQLKKVRTKDTVELSVDALLVNYGFMSNNSILKSWDLDLITTKNNLIPVNSKLETNLQNVYAIGDIANYPGRIDLIAVGMGEAPMAVNNALESLYPEKIQPKHSTQLVKNIKNKENN